MAIDDFYLGMWNYGPICTWTGTSVMWSVLKLETAWVIIIKSFTTVLHISSSKAQIYITVSWTQILPTNSCELNQPDGKITYFSHPSVCEWREEGEDIYTLESIRLFVFSACDLYFRDEDF